MFVEKIALTFFYCNVQVILRVGADFFHIYFSVQLSMWITYVKASKFGYRYENYEKILGIVHLRLDRNSSSEVTTISYSRVCQKNKSCSKFIREGFIKKINYFHGIFHGGVPPPAPLPWKIINFFNNFLKICFVV